MRNARRAVLIASMALSGMVGLTAGTANADNWQTPATTCSGRDLSSGVYEGLIITGECALRAGTTVEVDGNLSLASDATFDAASTGSLRVIGDIRVVKGPACGSGARSPRSRATVQQEATIRDAPPRQTTLSKAASSRITRGHCV
jgi:hypothetical protein